MGLPDLNIFRVNELDDGLFCFIIVGLNSIVFGSYQYGMKRWKNKVPYLIQNDIKKQEIQNTMGLALWHATTPAEVTCHDMLPFIRKISRFECWSSLKFIYA